MPSSESKKLTRVTPWHTSEGPEPGMLMKPRSPELVEARGFPYFGRLIVGLVKACLQNEAEKLSQLQ